nr:uncharacterized protein LOC129154750 [Nothobranchius furzeri]
MQRRILQRIKNMMDNPERSLHKTVRQRKSVFSQRLLQFRCNTDRYWRSFLPTAIVEEENVAEDAHINDSCASISQPPLKRPRTSCALVDLLGATFPSTSSDNTEPKSENELAAGEIKKYRGEAPLPLTENPLSWWKNHEQDYPQLSKIAKSLPCMPGASVSAERVFSSTCINVARRVHLFCSGCTYSSTGQNCSAVLYFNGTLS